MKNNMVPVEEALQIAKTFSDNLIAAMKDGFSVLSDQGVHIDVNPAFCRMTGFSKKELIGTGAPHLYWPPEEIGKIEKAFQQTLEDKSEDLELTFMRKNGERFPVIVSPSLIKDENGKMANCFATIKEITERKKAEEALRKITHDFKERNKELRCLHDFSQFIVKPGITLEEILQRTAELLPPACQYPDITHARIILDDKKYAATDFKSTKWNISSDITINGEKAGIFEMHCSKERPELDEKPFLKQEKDLLDSVASRLGKVVERKKAEEKSLALSKFPSENPNPVLRMDKDGEILYSNNAGLELLAHWDVKVGEKAPEKWCCSVKEMLESKKSGSQEEEEEEEVKGRIFSIAIYPVAEAGYVNLYGRDITKRREAEDALSYFKKSVDSATDAIGMSTPEGKHYYQNKTFSEMFGDIGSDPPGSVYVDEKVGRKIFQTIMAGDEWNGEIEMYGKGKKVLNILLRTYSIKNNNGKVVGLAGIHTDITERKKTEDQLKEKEAFSRALFENSPIETIAVNAEGKITAFNRAMKDSGHKLPKIGDIMYKDYAGKHSIDMHGQLMKCIEEKKVLEFPESKYGDKFLHITMSPLPCGAIITSPDITIRKKVDDIIMKKVRLETALYGISSRFISASDLIATSNMDKAINGSLADIGELSKADRSYVFLLREDGVTLDNTHEWCRKGISSQINNLQNISSKTIPWWMEKLRKDKIILIENVSKMPRAAQKEKKICQDQAIKSLVVLPLFKSKKIIGFMGLDSVQAAVKWTEDHLFLLRISAEIIEGALERVRAEKRLLQEKTKSEKLSEELKDAYENLRIIQNGLLKRAKIATTGVIAAGVAHEIRNPLAIIGMTIQYLQSKLHEKDPKRELTEAIIKKVERLDRVTKELSNYGRTMDLNLKKHSLKKCLDLNLALVKPKCRIQKIRIVKKYSKLPLVEMDDEQMDKAFLNIIDNAVQAMPRGGVLTVSTELGENPNTVVIRIHNTGPAINKRHLRYIFEPFYTLKAKHRGTGLGLAICQGVVLRHIGEIYVESNVSGKNKGVTFVIYLPLSHEKQKRNRS